MTKRIFRAIPFYTDYFASSDGHIWRKMRGRPRHLSELPICYVLDNELGWLRKLTASVGGKDFNYLRVSICQETTKTVHRLVLLTFSPHENSEFLQVNHINRNTFDNRVDNLEWMTNKENCQHRVATEKPKSYEEMHQDWLAQEAQLAADSDIYIPQEMGTWLQVYDKEAILDELASSPDTMQVIAERLGCSFRAVKYWQEKEKVKRPKVRLIDKVRKVLEERPNASSIEIAALVGSLNTSVNTVLRQIRAEAA
jgi:HNH endonuclease